MMCAVGVVVTFTTPPAVLVSALRFDVEVNLVSAHFCSASTVACLLVILTPPNSTRRVRGF